MGLPQELFDQVQSKLIQKRQYSESSTSQTNVESATRDKHVSLFDRGNYFAVSELTVKPSRENDPPRNLYSEGGWQPLNFARTERERGRRGNQTLFLFDRAEYFTSNHFTIKPSSAFDLSSNLVEYFVPSVAAWICFKLTFIGLRKLRSFNGHGVHEPLTRTDV